MLASVTLAAYVNSLGLGLAMDATLLVKDPRVEAVAIENLKNILTGPYWWGNPYAGLFRPVATLSLLFNYSVLGNGESGGGYHVVNLLLHLGNVFLFFALLRRMIDRPWTAWFAAALWAVHPAGVESVANVSGRADLLAGTAVLGGLLWYIRRAASDRANPVATAAVLFAIALAGVFSKENAAVLAGLMLLWDITYGPGRQHAERRLPAYAAALAAAVLLFAVRQQQPRMQVPLLDNPEVAAGFLGARLTALKVVGEYLLLLFFPWRLSSDYSYNQVPVSGPGDPAGWLWAVLIAALLAAAVLRRKRDPLIFFAAGWFGIALLPVSNLVVIIGSIKAERFLYLPAAGFAIAAAALGERAARRWGPGRKRAVAAVAAALIGAFALRTVVRNPDWKDDATLWAANIRTAPGSYKAYKGLATALYDRDPNRHLDEVTRLLETAFAIVQDAPPAEQPENVLTDLGVCYRLKGDRAGGAATEAGRAWYRKSLDILLRARKLDRAADLRMLAAERARGLEPQKVFGMRELYLNLGNVYLNLGNTAAALEAVGRGRLVEPHNPAFHVSLAAVHMARQEPGEAALRLLEQWLVGAATADTDGQLRGLYAQFPDGACAFPDGQMNPDCPRLRRDLCAASAGIVRVLVEARQTNEARTLKESLRERYACPGS